MAKKKKSAVIETGKFVLRMVMLVGVPATLSAIIQDNPELGTIIGLALAMVDKYVHELPNEYRGLVPF